MSDHLANAFVLCEEPCIIQRTNEYPTSEVALLTGGLNYIDPLGELDLAALLQVGRVGLDELGGGYIAQRLHVGARAEACEFYRFQNMLSAWSV